MKKFLLVSTLCVLGSAAYAASNDSLAQRYRRSLQTLEENRESMERTRSERDRLQAEAEDLRKRLVLVAGRVQEAEAAYAETEAQLAMLNETLRRLESDLERDRDKVAHLLAVLQRLDADTPPALALRPDDSLAAARGTMQLGAVLPPVYSEAAALANRLKKLEETQAAISAKAQEGRAQAEALRRSRVELDGLLQLRNQQQAEAGEKIAELQGISGEIARRARDLKGLIDRIAALRAAAGGNDGVTVVTAGRGPVSTLSQGTLRFPVAGKILPQDLIGSANIPGQPALQGLWFEAPGTAETVAPADSVVVFAGPYQKFGQVLILELTGGYHLTLAGLGRIDVHIGDRVLAGEPVGELPNEMPARLYLELRHNGQTVDPAPWLSVELRKANGT